MDAHIILADHHVMFRECLANGLNAEAGMSVVAEVSDAAKLLPLARDGQANVIIVEAQMPGASLSVLSDLRKTAAGVQVLFLTDTFADCLIQESMRIGVCGYVLKRYPMAILFEAIRTVLCGNQYFVFEVQQRMLAAASDGTASVDTRFSKVSPREMVVLRLLAEGQSVKQVAYELSVSYKTVDNQTSSLMRKLDIHSRAELVRYAIREQLATV